MGRHTTSAQACIVDGPTPPSTSMSKSLYFCRKNWIYTEKKFKYLVSLTYNGCPQESAVSLLCEQMQVTVFLHINNDSDSSLEKYHISVHKNGFQFLELHWVPLITSTVTTSTQLQ